MSDLFLGKRQPQKQVDASHEDETLPLASMIDKHKLLDGQPNSSWTKPKKSVNRNDKVVMLKVTDLSNASKLNDNLTDDTDNLTSLDQPISEVNRNTRERPAVRASFMLEKSDRKDNSKNKSTVFGRIRSFTNKGNNNNIRKSERYVSEDLNPEVCLLKSSPLRIFKCAQNGNAKEVARIIKSDPTRLYARNPQGQMPIHVAVSKGHLVVVQVLVKANADINAVDDQGNAALHLAILAQSLAIVTFLLKHGADVFLKNNAQMMPVHVAAEMASLEVMQALLDNGADPTSTGESGSTVLHYAAAQDSGDMMRLIMAKGAKPCVKCDFGYYPIHIAAKCAAANSMEALIEQALKTGYTREEILNFRDRENNLPLHSAVNGGNLKEDGSTPLHFACSQGNMDMIKLMKESQTENFIMAIHSQDAMKMTPLHRAALFNHRHVIEYLLNERADMEAKDIYERTPLLLAASKGSWATVQLLIARNADVRVKDQNNRNFLHLAIKFGGKLKSIADPSSRDMMQLLNERDDFGCTPLHYASKEGHLYALDDLMKMGALLNLKDNHKQSPIHFAARYGRINTCRRLLDSVHGPNLINETDGEGHSALHIAAQNGHTKIIQLLLERGAVVSKDNEDSTALHHAASQGWTHSMKILLGVHQNLRDATNLKGDTALHVAAKSGQVPAVWLLLSLDAKISKNNEGAAFFDYVIQLKHVDVAVAVVNHDRWEEVLLYPSALYKFYILGLIQHLPTVCVNVLDRCQVPSLDDPRSSKFHITYNFKFLDAGSFDTKTTKDKPDDDTFWPMMSLNAMVKNNRVECLSHPVCITFLQGKWRRYGMWVYTAYLLVYLVFLGSLTSLAVNENSLRHFDNDMDVAENKTDEFNEDEKSSYHCQPAVIVSLWLVVIYSGLNMIKEILQIFYQKSRYFMDIANVLEWSLYITSMVFVLPYLIKMSLYWQLESGAIAVFLTWFNCLVFLQKFDFFGIYVVMFLEILRTLLQVLCVFSILIIAFGLAFYMLMFKENSKAYSTPGLSFLRTFMMMLEIDYMSSFNEQFVDNRSDTLHFGKLTLVFLAIFVLLMPILLMNLLIGLAVGDIESVQRNARLKRLAMQVELHINMERKMPKFLKTFVYLAQYKHYPNKCRTLFTKMCMLITQSGGTSDTPQYTDSGPYQPSNMGQELLKQKARMRDMTTMLEKNHHLLRKIMEKMEIHTEEDAWDEGGELKSDDSESEQKSTSRRSRVKSVKNEGIKAAVLSLWTGGRKHSR